VRPKKATFPSQGIKKLAKNKISGLNTTLGAKSNPDQAILWLRNFLSS